MVYTTHGHHIVATIKGDYGPKMIARCGGPRLCSKCSKEASQHQPKEKQVAIRTKEYRFKAGGNRRVRAIRLTAKNIAEVAAYVTRNGGLAESREMVNGGQPRIDIYQKNVGATHNRRGWRVAQLGDFIVKYEDGSFARVKDDVFEATFTLA